MTQSRQRFCALLITLLVAGPLGLKAQTGSIIILNIDATQAPQKIIHTHMVLPVSPGPLTFYYPKWIPGEHAPDGPIANVAGLKLTANGHAVPWRRDLLDMFTFHATVPPAATQLDISFDYLEPEETSGFTAGSSATAKMAVISWNQNLLYPAGRLAQDILFKATLKLPSGWKFGTALPIDHQSGDEIEFKPVSLNRLVDSPVISGEYLRAVNVTPAGEPIHHEIDLAADSEAALDMGPELQQEYTNLVAESGKLFGARHYRDYHFLLSLSDHVAHFGLEHHESDDSRVAELSLVEPDRRQLVAILLPHEFVHSWNGKFRRPKGLSTPYYEEPQQTGMLWVYEGLTEYLGDLLTARSGLWTPKQYRENLALTAAALGPGRPGRTWRPLQDTADAAQILYFAPAEWLNWRRGVDFYDEGLLLWLNVATIIHEQTHGQKSLEDFCHLFYGGPNQGPELKPYTFEDLVAALNQIAPYHWAEFFEQYLTSTSPEALLAGIEASGWKVDYTDVEPDLLRAEEEIHDTVNEVHSIGLLLKKDGSVQDSIVTMPAYKAGISPGMSIAAVNGHRFSPQVLHAAIKAAKTSSEPLQFLVDNDGYYKTFTVDYHGGERYAHLIRDVSRPDLLDQILKPLVAH